MVLSLDLSTHLSHDFTPPPDPDPVSWVSGLPFFEPDMHILSTLMHGIRATGVPLPITQNPSPGDGFTVDVVSPIRQRRAAASPAIPLLWRVC